MNYLLVFINRLSPNYISILFLKTADYAKLSNLVNKNNYHNNQNPNFRISKNNCERFSFGKFANKLSSVFPLLLDLEKD